MSKRKHKKTFLCGHKGHGKECAYCRQEAHESARKAQEQAERQRQRNEWVASFDQDAVDLRGLPEHVVLKSRCILADLHKGKHFQKLSGKRMHFDKSVVRIPVGLRYRMLCREDKGCIIPLMVLSHEDYNAYANNKRQVS
ncbi:MULTISPECIES: hypothetical protein [Cyanophyceae]|uniref:ParE-like toxin domain-containing protein n=1 Tax=Leptolyngbya subtilissima DQ-A4 TaxID=2933933 RepID=A0ABV0K9V5_9CYAN|nr:hypothetical protein [Nodosilinea sp. FACHB-141]MBD2110890.1 hypothetical protein [Nodosilinea sp. FACHB-141]